MGPDPADPGHRVVADMMGRLAPARAAEDGRCSPTQISLYRDCARKWAYAYLAGLPRAANAYALVGTAIHGVLEAYLRTGALPGGPGIVVSVEAPHGRIEYDGEALLRIVLPYLGDLPPPGRALVEQSFELDLGPLGVLGGYVDYLLLDPVLPVVGDHKSTGDLRWALTEEQLRRDPQGIVYGVYALEATGAEQVRLRWGYVCRDPARPRRKIVETVLSVADCAEPWAGILADCASMRRLRDSAVDAAEVERDVSACDKYGGCPHLPICGLTSADRLKGLGAMVNLKDLMKSKQLSTVPEPQPVNPPEGASALTKLKARAATVAPEPQQADPSRAAKPKARAATPEGFTAYVNCRPTGPVTEFASIAVKAAKTIEIERGAPYRLLPDLYGGNAALFAETVGDYLDLNPPAHDIVMDLASEMARDGLDAVLTRATKVVRGF